MHIEPGIVTGAKIALSYATAAGAAVYSAKLIWEALRNRGIPSLGVRAAIATVAVFVFFELLPHMAVGVSEVHLILGTTLLLILGTAPAAIGLALGLLIQGAFFAPSDLPQYAMNVTTLLVPLFGLHMLSKHVITKGTAYVDLSFKQCLAMSATYQGGIVLWVAFWAFYGSGFGAENISAVLSFGAAYMLVLLIEPIADLAVLAAAKGMRNLEGSALVTPRLYSI
ncbi:cobalt uptake protein with substrate-specific transmembrane region [Yoonia maricola]|uniref:Cobalt uptake protein with substrate-specific transmembrane region n=1 Tax=Yoonia maricola TaxID=420999 RepID=A0A2M8WQ83_9RHOB|nr:energy-coupling factor ABC transporter permease [Yoonia maricola]PJI92996.1 cobalt uptake protein with substrate-specific transmembrane region [Yoonia maricola]